MLGLSPSSLTSLLMKWHSETSYVDSKTLFSDRSPHIFVYLTEVNGGREGRPSALSVRPGSTRKSLRGAAQATRDQTAPQREAPVRRERVLVTSRKTWQVFLDAKSQQISDHMTLLCTHSWVPAPHSLSLSHSLTLSLSLDKTLTR